MENINFISIVNLIGLTNSFRSLDCSVAQKESLLALSHRILCSLNLYIIAIESQTESQNRNVHRILSNRFNN